MKRLKFFALLISLALPFQNAAAKASTAELSANWSGYAAQSGIFTAVKGQWTVPEIKADKNFKTDSTWVGIGGVSSSDLIQTGTQSFTDSGQVHYAAWYELLPDYSKHIAMTVQSGDQISASILEIDTNRWKISLDNITTGEHFEKLTSYKSSRSSAEWIEEAPSSEAGLLPLDNFKRIRFQNCSAIKDGRLVSLAEAGADAVALGSGSGKILAVPGKIKPSSKGFDIVRSIKRGLKRIFKTLPINR